MSASGKVFFSRLSVFAHPMVWAGGLSLALVAGACGNSGDDDDDAGSPTPTQVPETPTPEPEPATGRLALTFAMDELFVPEMDEGEEPKGMFYGAIFRGDDVTSTGPVQGAEELESVTVEIDMTPDGGATAVVYHTGELPTGEVAILGFLDSDSNVEGENYEPDRKDPVTLPWDNKFDVVGGEETTVEVFFGMLNP